MAETKQKPDAKALPEPSTPTRKIGAGTLSAAFRLGAKEIGTALKAFPDSIQLEEPGSILSPTQGEIAEKNRESTLAERVQTGREQRETSPTKEPVKGIERE